MKPDRRLIAVSQRVVEVSARGETRDCLDQAWATWLHSLGFTLIPVPNRLGSVSEFLDAVQPTGIILSGGNNLMLPAYEEVSGADPITDAYQSRDTTEQHLVEYVLRENLPMLGCCRGMQFLQAFFGGRLSSLRNSSVKHVSHDHGVVFTDEKYQALAEPGSTSVNSYHNYGIRPEGVAHPFQPFAVSADDLSVEGFAHREKPIVGIMWHPERRNPSAVFDRELFLQLFDSRFSQKR